MGDLDPTCNVGLWSVVSCRTGWAPVFFRIISSTIAINPACLTIGHTLMYTHMYADKCTNNCTALNKIHKENHKLICICMLHVDVKALAKRTSF